MHSMSDSISKVVVEYEEALKDLLAVYSQMQPPKPIQFNITDPVGSTFNKIVQPYVAELSGYSKLVMLGFARKFPYYQDLETLSKKFTTYQQEVQRLTAYFPSGDRKAAMEYFYQQLATSMVQACSKIVQQASYALNTDAQALQAASTAYNLAWAAQTKDMKIDGFSSDNDFRDQVTSYMTQLFQAAIKQQNEALEKEKDQKETFDNIVSYYNILSKVYANNGNLQQAETEKRNAGVAQQKAKSINQAHKLYQEAEDQANIARTAIIINFSNPEDTKTKVIQSIQELKNVEKMYAQVESLYQEQLNFAGVALCKAKQSEVIADQRMRGIQLLWTLFLTNQVREGISSSPLTHMEQFFKGDVTQETGSLDEMIKALSDLYGLCMTSPNAFNESLALQSLISEAIELYQAADIGHVHAHHPDRLSNKTTLDSLQQGIKTFSDLIKGMIQFGKDPSSSSVDIASLLHYATTMDMLFQDNNAFKDFFIKIFQIAATSHAQATFTSFVMQYVYKVCVIQYVLYMKDESNKQNGERALLSLVKLQGYKDELSTDQLSNIEQYMQKIIGNINISQVISQAVRQASQSQNWKNSTQGLAIYQSEANSLWQKALALYTVFLQISSEQDLEKSYLEALNQYAAAYLQNVTPYIGYQLYIAVSVYKLYVGADKLNDQELASSAQNMLATLFEQKGNFLETVRGWQDQIEKSEGTAKSQEEAQSNLSDIVKIFQKVEQSELVDLKQFMTLFQLERMPRRLLESYKKDDTTTLMVSYGQNNFSVEITASHAQQLKVLDSEIESLQQQAQQAESKLDFATAASLYAKLEQLYITAIKLAQKAFLQQSYKQKYFLVKTKQTACSLASSVVSTGAEQLGTIVDIPTQYYAKEYTQASIVMSDLASSLPISLQGFTTKKVLTKPEEIAEARAIFKAFIIRNMLLQQGISFADCFTSYQLSMKSSIAENNKQAVEKVEQEITAYINLFSETEISVLVAGEEISLFFKNMPIPAIDPFYPTATYAGVYFIGASTLFQPGTKLLTIAGGSYVPGQDEASAQVAFANLAYAYLLEAKIKLDGAKDTLQKLVSTVVPKKDQAAQEIDIKTFMPLYNESKKMFVRAQALLFATGSSAYAYFVQAKDTQKADMVKEIFIETYKTQIDLLEQLLVGNPFSQSYMTVVSDINQGYVSWSAELNPNKDMAQINKNSEAIIALYVKAANDCMSYKYQGKMFPSVEQYHYIGAAKDYLAARKQYLSMKDTANASKLNEQAMKAYFLACAQNIKLYFSVKKDGMLYTPVEVIEAGSTQSTKPQQISYAELKQANIAFQNALNVNSGKIQAFTAVKRLLLDAAMFYQYLAGHYQKEVKDLPSPPGKQAKGMNPQLLSYLKDHNMVVSGATSVDYAQFDTRQKIFGKATDMYVHFVDNSAALASLCNTLNMAVAYQYIEDYLGGLKETGDDKAHDFQQKWQTFFQAVQKEGSAFQNPAASYVG